MSEKDLSNHITQLKNIIGGDSESAPDYFKNHVKTQYSAECPPDDVDIFTLPSATVYEDFINEIYGGAGGLDDEMFSQMYMPEDES